MNKKSNNIRSQFFMLGASIASIVVVAIGVFFYQTYTKQLVIGEAQESVLRQDEQHLHEETQAAEQALTNDGSASSTISPSVSTQSFSGTLQSSAYRERAVEVGAPMDMFPDSPIMLLILDAPTSVSGYCVGDDAPSTREIKIIKVPNALGKNDEKANIEVQNPIYWPSDVSGMLWDLDLSELESLKAESSYR